MYSLSAFTIVKDSMNKVFEVTIYDKAKWFKKITEDE